MKIFRSHYNLPVTKTGIRSSINIKSTKTTSLFYQKYYSSESNNTNIPSSSNSSSKYIKLRLDPPLYFYEPTSTFSLYKPSNNNNDNSSSSSSSSILNIGHSIPPLTKLSNFSPLLPSGDTTITSQGGTPQSTGEAGFTAPEIYPIPSLDPSGTLYFTENPQFLNLILQPVLEKNIHQCLEYNRLAEAELFYGGQTLHIFDLRAPPPYGRIPDVQDILGTVRLQKQEYKEKNDDKNDTSENLHPGDASSIYKIPPIVPNSFEYNPMYRLLTRNGFLHVSPYLNSQLIKACKEYMASASVR